MHDRGSLDLYKRGVYLELTPSMGWLEITISSRNDKAN